MRHGPQSCRWDDRSPVLGAEPPASARAIRTRLVRGACRRGLVGISPRCACGRLRGGRSARVGQCVRGRAPDRRAAAPGTGSGSLDLRVTEQPSQQAHQHRAVVPVGTAPARRAISAVSFGPGRGRRWVDLSWHARLVNPGDLRAGDADRERVAERLRTALDEGRLNLYEYDERLRDAYAAKTYSELDALVGDLPSV